VRRPNCKLDVLEALALLKGHDAMLAPMIFNVLVFSLLLLALGWVSDVVRARSHNGRRSLNCEGIVGCNLMSHPRTSLLLEHLDATPTARRVRPLRRFRRLPSHKLSIGRLRQHAPDFVH
jgi:hypothetical protein